MANPNAFKVLSYEEERKLSKEEFIEYDKKLQAWVRLQQTEIAPGYDELTKDEKIQYWVTRLGRTFRSQAESGLDPYLSYTPEWYENIKRFEPDLDELIKAAFKGSLYWEWDFEEFMNRIK